MATFTGTPEPDESDDPVDALAAELYRSEFGAVLWRNLPLYARNQYVCRAHDILRVVRPLIERATRREIAETLRHAASGRREYLTNCPQGDGYRAIERDCTVMDNAAEIVLGNDAPLYGWLPSWRWSQRMHDNLQAALDARTTGSSDDASSGDSTHVAS